VGAHNGYTVNDGYILDKLREDDNAIFIEPIKELFETLVTNHKKYKPKNKYNFINKACSNINGTLDLYIPNIDFFSIDVEPKYIQMRLPQWTDQLVSVLPNHVKDHHINLDTRKVSVECVTLDRIIDEYKISSIDILHIDTEGHDYEVIDGINLENVKPNTIVFENKHMDGTNSPLGKKYESIINYLVGFGYRKLREEFGDTYMILES
jgi:FkbM family methyltransferase